MDLLDSCTPTWRRKKEPVGSAVFARRPNLGGRGCRIDARQELAAKLNGLSTAVSLKSSDAELIWHAYRAWGEGCDEYLLGDFAFIIADTRSNRLLCSRDQLGVKPLFYAADDAWLVVSNLLECVRDFQFVDQRLDDCFILDFLMHGWNTDVCATAFRSIRRLPPAHVLECTPKAAQQKRYWSLSLPAEDESTKAEAHVERFLELFESAVSDRLRNQAASVAFSGGKDSTAVAATALRLQQFRSVQPELHAHCAVYDRIIPDQERRYATLAAQALGLPLQFVVCDDFPVFNPDWDAAVRSDARTIASRNPVVSRMMTAVTRPSPIVLSGHGGDEAIRPPVRYYEKLLREGRWPRWLLDCRRIWLTCTDCRRLDSARCCSRRAFAIDSPA